MSIRKNENYENYDVSVHIRSFNRIHPSNRQKQPLKGALKN